MNSSISVVILVFNGASLIGRAIQSALDQTHPPQEVIVISDGSTDGTMDALSVFGPKIKVISISNGRISISRNIGIRASSGKLIEFPDADDIWHREKLALQMAALNEHGNVGFCCCGYSVSHKHIGQSVNNSPILEISLGSLSIIFDCLSIIS